mgnify:FL=1
MSAQHTPGPWIGTLFSNGGFFVGADTKPPRLAICERIPLPHLAAESIANALLIAAAPELLAEVIEANGLLTALAVHLGPILSEKIIASINERVAALDAVTAKAEGSFVAGLAPATGRETQHENPSALLSQQEP